VKIDSEEFYAAGTMTGDNSLSKNQINFLGGVYTLWRV